jgi:hypothetical protein
MDWDSLSDDELRERIIALSPQIAADCQHLVEVLRELVKLEREKRGLDQPSGTIILYRNNKKRSAGDPDLVGSGKIAGRPYRVSGWFLKASHSVRLILQPPFPK